MSPILSDSTTLLRPPVDTSLIARVLAEIAEIASETLELQEVFDRVAAAARELIPFDSMGVVRVVNEDSAVIHASTFPCRNKGLECVGPMPMTAWSPRMRPRPGPNPRIEDATLEFDPAYPFDAQALRGGVRSGLWEPFHSGDGHWGGVWLAAYQPHAFIDEHQDLLRPIAALMGSAVEHWRIWDAERSRRTRLELLEALLRTLAESLDVREVFSRISEEAKPLLPHDVLVLTELEPAARTFRVIAVAGEADVETPESPILMTEEETARRAVDYEILRDIPAEVIPATERERLFVASGMRSCLRVPVWRAGEARGSLVFLHREPERFGGDDVEIAARLADRVALMLSHQKLAEEARRAAEAREKAERLEARVRELAHQLASREVGRIVGVSPSWRETLLAVERVASSDTTVLITGESGTGKEVISSLVHQGSPRAAGPFIAINCAALPEQLLESELFGHEKGAFTGAVSNKIGKIEQATGGTLFLDEIAEMSPLVQAKLLRVLESREFQRLGGTRTLKADLRLIAATHRDLAVAMDQQEFRRDLFYRLNVFQIPIAPLRERPEDILPLAESFLEELGRSMGRPAAGISRDAREWLLAYSWPGNIRELKNAIERAILLCDGGLITRSHLPAVPLPNPSAEVPPATGIMAGTAANVTGTSAGTGPNAFSLPGGVGPGAIPAGGVDLEAIERDFVIRALEQAKGNKSRAARLLNLTRAQLYTRIEKYRLG